MKSHSPNDTVPRRSVFCAAVLFALVLCLTRYWTVLDSPFDQSLASINATYYMAPMVRAWSDHGFFALRGEPLLFHLDSSPPFKREYHHHPPLWPWIVYSTVRLVGFNETGFRLAPIFFAAAAAGCLAWILGRRLGIGAAFSGGAMFAAMPISFFFGWMSNPESATLFFILVSFLVRDFRSTSNSRILRFLAGVSPFLGILCDWQAAFILPMLALYEFWTEKPERRWSRLAAPCLGLTCGTLFILGCFTLWKGSAVDAVRFLFAMAFGTGHQTWKVYTAGEWWQNQWNFWVRGLTLPGILTLLAALPWILWRSLVDRCVETRLALLLFVPGLANVLVFRSHAYDHSFWWYYGLPFAVTALVLLFRATSTVRGLSTALLPMACAAGAARVLLLEGQHVSWTLAGFAGLLALGALRVKTRRNGVPLILVLVVLLAAWHEIKTEWRTTRPVPDVKSAADSFTGLFHTFFQVKPGQQDLFVRLDRFGPETFYFPFQSLSELTDVGQIRVLAHLHREGRSGLRNLVFLCPAHVLTNLPDVALLLPDLGSLHPYGQVTVVIARGP